jgi:hydrogenase assembly chaperone HypC/HupF
VCLAVLGRVLAVDDRGDRAHVDVDGVERTIGLAPLTLAGRAVAPGDWVVAHSGLAVERLDADEGRRRHHEHQRLRSAEPAAPTPPGGPR